MVFPLPPNCFEVYEYFRSKNNLPSINKTTLRKIELEDMSVSVGNLRLSSKNV